METSVACRAVESRRESQRPPYLSSTFTVNTRVPVYQTGSFILGGRGRPVQMSTVTILRLISQSVINHPPTVKHVFREMVNFSGRKLCVYFIQNIIQYICIIHV